MWLKRIANTGISVPAIAAAQHPNIRAGSSAAVSARTSLPHSQAHTHTLTLTSACGLCSTWAVQSHESPEGDVLLLYLLRLKLLLRYSLLCLCSCCGRVS